MENVLRGLRSHQWSNIRSFKKCNKDELSLDLMDTPWHVMETFDNADDMHGYWKSLFLSILDKHAPLVKMRARKDSYEWIDEDIHKLMRSRNYYRRKFQKSNDQNDWEEFR